MTLVRAKPTLIRRSLREETDALSPRVDRAAGVIRGVKVLGLSSPNRHGVEGATGTAYAREALQQARPLYEGAAVNCDHPDRKRPHADRSSRDRIGWLSNVEVREDGLYADLHLLKSDPLTEKVFEAAERNPRLFGLSHNAVGRGEVRNGKYVIIEIPEVRSVDLVADPGTNRSLFESRNMKTLREVAEARAPDVRRRLRPLLEMDGMADLPVGDAAVPEAPAEPGDWKADLVAAIGKLVASEDEADHKLAQKIMAMLKPGAAEPPKAAVTEESDGEESGEEGEEEKATRESRQRRARALCELAGIAPEADLLESLGAMASEDAVLKHLAWLKKQVAGAKAPAKGGAPRSQAAGSVSTLESRQPEKVPEGGGKAVGRWLSSV